MLPRAAGRMIGFMSSPQATPMDILLSELSSLDAELKDSGIEYTAADAAYDKDAPELREKVDPRVKQYGAPDRAAILRDASTELIRRMDHFSETRAEAFERLSELRLRLNQNVLASRREAIDGIVKSQGSSQTASTSPVSSTKDWLKSLTKAQVNAVLIASQIALAGRKIVDAQRLGAQLCDLRKERLGSYLSKAASTGAKIRKAAKDLLKDEARDEAIKELITASAEVAGVAAQAAPVVKIATVSYSLYKKVSDMKPYTPKGDVDDVLDLLSQVRSDDDSNEELVQLLGSLNDALAVSIP